MGNLTFAVPGERIALLDAKAIRYVVKNEALGVAAGELPPIAMWPEIWVLDDERLEEARTILAELAKPVEPTY
jgi:hypothetical protein